MGSRSITSDRNGSPYRRDTQRDLYRRAVLVRWVVWMPTGPPSRPRALGGPANGCAEHCARALFWEGDDPATARTAELLRQTIAQGADLAVWSGIVESLYEFCGVETTSRVLSRHLAGRTALTERLVTWMRGTDLDPTRQLPFIMEFDLVGQIAFRELNFDPPSDGGPFDPSAPVELRAQQHPSFEAEPFDLPAALPGSPGRPFCWSAAGT